MTNYYIPHFSDESIKNVKEKLNPQTSKACNNDIMWSPNKKTYSGNYYGHSLKRSKLNDCTFSNAIFDHTSFSGSILENIKFSSDCKIDSLYMEQCTLMDVKFMQNLYINGANFSFSYLKNLIFDNNELRSTYFNNCYMENCTFNNCLIRSTMFGDAYMCSCKFVNCNMRNLNIEFSTMDNCILDGTCISYFQFPYIIGIFKDFDLLSNVSVGRNGSNPIPFEDYYKDIEDSIIYFTSLKEYFPMANLYYAINKPDIAYSCIMVGIEKALFNNDIRMIQNFCKLGQFYDILKISDIQMILKKVDAFIDKNKDNDIFPVLLKQSYNLKGEIYQNRNKAKLEIVINTSITEKDFNEVGKFCEDIDTIICGIMPAQITTSYNISHNSPFEICVNCIGAVADLLTISGFIYSYITKRLSKGTKINPQIQEYIDQSNKAYINSLNSQFDFFSKILEKTTKQKQREIIQDFRGKIISSATEQLNKDYALIISQNSQR